MSLVRVAVGVVLDVDSRVLIARRAAHQHQGNRWEFPGGKIESGESLAEALIREFREEVSLELQPAPELAPWMVVEHDYGDKQVRLEVALITAFSGEAKGLEGQEIAWQPLHSLSALDFPAANVDIIEGLLAERPSVVQS